MKLHFQSKIILNVFFAKRFGAKKDDGLYVDPELIQEQIAQLVRASRGWVKLEPRAVIILDYERLIKRGK